MACTASRHIIRLFAYTYGSVIAKKTSITVMRPVDQHYRSILAPVDRAKFGGFFFSSSPTARKDIKNQKRQEHISDAINFEPDDCNNDEKKKKRQKKNRRIIRINFQSGPVKRKMRSGPRRAQVYWCTLIRPIYDYN